MQVPRRARPRAPAAPPSRLAPSHLLTHPLTTPLPPPPHAQAIGLMEQAAASEDPFAEASEPIKAVVQSKYSRSF